MEKEAEVFEDEVSEVEKVAGGGEVRIGSDVIYVDCCKPFEQTEVTGVDKDGDAITKLKPPVHIPAKIIELRGKGCVDLHIEVKEKRDKMPFGYVVPMVEFSEEPKYRTWHWPEK